MLLGCSNASNLHSILSTPTLMVLFAPNGVPKPLDLESISVPPIVQVTVMFLVRLKFGGFVLLLAGS